MNHLRAVGVYLGAIAAMTVIALLLVSAVVEGQGAKTFTLRGGHYANPGAFFAEEQRFADTLGARSNQRLKLNIVWSSGFGKSNELLGLTGRRAIDAAAVPTGHYPDVLPFNKVFQLPFIGLLPSDYGRIKETLLKEFPEFEQEYTKQGVKRLFYQSLPAFWAIGNGDPSKCNLAGLVGKKIRTFGDALPKMMAAVGAVPVDIAPVEWYEALQRRTIDFTSAPLGTVLDNKLHEVANLACGPVFTFVGHDWVVNLETFNSLPPDLQTLVVDTANETRQRYVDFATERDQKGQGEIAAKGMKLAKLAAEDLAKWRERTPDLLGFWVKDLAGKGLGDRARVIADRFRELVAKSR